MTNAARGKKIIERLGAKFHLRSSLVGSNAPAMIIVIETADWKAYGEYTAKVNADAEWQKFVEDLGSSRDPAVEPLGNALSSDVPLG